MFIACHPASEFCALFVYTIWLLFMLYLLGLEAHYSACHENILFHFLTFRYSNFYPYPLDLLLVSNLSRQSFESSYIIAISQSG